MEEGGGLDRRQSRYEVNRRATLEGKGEDGEMRTLIRRKKRAGHGRAGAGARARVSVGGGVALQMMGLAGRD